MNNRREQAQLIAQALVSNGFSVWFTPGRTNVRTNASIREARAALDSVEYPAHLVMANTSYSQGRIGEFSTIVKTA